MFSAIKSFLDPAQGSRSDSGMGNENSQPSGSTTPLSDSFSLFSEPTGRKRSSACSTAQHTPEEPPEVDISHLSEEEKAKIAAVIGRARQMQDDENKRIRFVLTIYLVPLLNFIICLHSIPVSYWGRSNHMV